VEDVKWKLRKEVVARLAGIATRLWLASPSPSSPPPKVVAQNEEKISQLLEQVSR
jgi:hypothetical protein